MCSRAAFGGRAGDTAAERGDSSPDRSPRPFSIHLDDRPDVARRICASAQRLNSATGRAAPTISRERRQSLSEDEQTAEHHLECQGFILTVDRRVNWAPIDVLTR